MNRVARFAQTLGSTVDIDHSKLLKELAEPVQIGDRVKAQIQRASRLSGLSYWRAFDIWYRRYKRVDFRESEAIVHAVKLKRAESQSNDLQQLRIQIARLEALHSQANTDLDRQEFDRSRRGSGALGRDYGALDRAMARK